jgi:hypothetical protein
VVRVNEHLIATGAELDGRPLDAEGEEALQAMREVMSSPGLAAELRIERGQLQYLHNHEYAHSRTDFRDAPEAHLKRHLIRVRTREDGEPGFEGRA